MGAETVGSLILWLIVLAVVVAIAVYLMRWLYRRSTKETAFVRTGFGGEKVVISGGAFVVPVLHEITPVGMNVMRIEIARRQTQGLITKNRMRVDVVADFYVRVGSTREEVSRAAQTLGRRTLESDGVRELLEGRFAAALRTGAAQMTLEELHERRQDYAEAVKAAALEGLAQNGLELESVAIVDLDQTGLEFFDSSNAFDAEGLTQLTEAIEARRRMRNEIEQRTQIEIRTQNLEAQRRALDIEREAEYARLEQEHDVELQTHRAAPRARQGSRRAGARKRADADRGARRSREGETRAGAQPFRGADQEPGGDRAARNRPPPADRRGRDPLAAADGIRTDPARVDARERRASSASGSRASSRCNAAARSKSPR